MTDVRTSKLDATMLDHDPARDDRISPRSARADAILDRVLAVPESTALDLSSSGARRRWHFVLPASGVAVAATVALLVVALVAAPAGRAPGGGGRPAAVGHSHKPGGTSAWRLVSDLSPSWRVLPDSGYDAEAFVPFTCPTPNTCYADVLASGPTPGPFQNEIELTHDGGNAWQQSVLPITFSGPGALACVDADTCAILGIGASGRPTFLETTDGGQTWSSHPGPTGLTSATGMRGLACTSAVSCVAVPGDPVGDSADAVAFVTRDGGNTWDESAMPVGFSQGPGSLRCPSSSTCVVGGASQSRSGAVSGGIAYSTDGGSSWLMATGPADLGAASLSCGGPSDCLASSEDIGGQTKAFASRDGGKTWVRTAASGLPDGSVTSLSCGGASECWAGGITFSGDGSGPATITGGILASTSDGGQTFDSAALPPGTGAVLNVSCPSATNCYAIASQENHEIALLAYGTATSGS